MKPTLRSSFAAFAGLFVFWAPPKSLAAPFAAPSQLPSATRAKLEALLAAPELASAHVGISVRALGTVLDAKQFPAANYDGDAQPEILEHDAARRFIPASNTKSFTCASALHYLGGEFRFATRVMASGTLVQSTLKGDLSLVGGGDPSLSSSDIEKLAQQVAQSGLREIQGDVVGDGGAFRAETFGGRYPDGWTLDDAIWYYGPEISALAIDRNQVDVEVRGTRPGQSAQMSILPALAADFPILNRVVTSRSLHETDAAISFERADGQSALGPNLTISGRIAAGQKRSEGVAIPDPPRRAARVFARALQRLGVRIRGRARSGHARPVAVRRLLARHDSAPLKTLLAACLKPSDNLYAEMLLRDTAWYHDGKGSPDMASRAHQLLFAWLQSAGVATTDLQFTDGSGLSRYNLVTPRATTQMLAATQNLPNGIAFWNALPIAGVDGTMKKRLRTPLATGNVRAKSGTFSIVSALSGFVTTRDNHRLAVSILSNFGRGTAMRALQNAIFQTLAEATLSPPLP